MRKYRDGFGNKCTRVVAPVGLTEFRSDLIVLRALARQPLLLDLELPDRGSPQASEIAAPNAHNVGMRGRLAVDVQVRRAVSLE
jgi:hypothetical protein